MKRLSTYLLLLGIALLIGMIPAFAQEDDRNIQIIRAENAERIAEKYVFDAEQGVVSGVSYMPLLDVLVSSSYENAWHGWNLKTGESLTSVDGEGEFINAITSTNLSSDLKIMAYAATLEGRGAGVVLDVDSSERQYLIGHEGEIFRMEISPNGAYVATSSTDNTVRIWDTSNGEQLHIFEDDVPALALAFARNNQLLAVSGSKLRFYNVESGEAIVELDGERASALAFAEYGDDRMVLIAQPGILNILSLTNQEDSFALPLPEESQFYRISVSFFERIVAVGGNEQPEIFIYSFDKDDSGLLTVLEGHTDGITDLRFDFIGNQIASASLDGTVRVWEVPPED